MATTCIDKILCENAWDCNITVLDGDGNPVDPLDLNDGDSVIFVLGDKPGYRFNGWTDEEGNYWQYTSLGDNRYLFRSIDCSKQYLATFCAITYNVDIRGTTDCFNNHVVTTHYGSVVTIEANDTAGCRFLYWSKDNSPSIYSEAHSFEYVVTDDVVFYAHYDNITYLIVAKPNKRNRGTCTGGGYYNLQDSVTIQATPEKGYHFLSWDDGNVDNPRTVTVNGNKTYVANFEPWDNNVYVPSTEGGTVIGSGTYVTGRAVSLQAIPNAGWEFSHWYMDGQTYDKGTLNFVVDEDKTAIPYFTRRIYTVNFTATPYACGSFTPSVGNEFTYGQTFTVEAVPNYGYDFVGWKDGFTETKRQITVTNDSDYVAVFVQKPIMYKTKVVLNGADSCAIYVGYSDVSRDYTSYVDTRTFSGTNLKISPVVPDGKRIVSMTDGNGNIVWSTSTKQDSPEIPYEVGNSDETLTLNFEDDTFNVTLTADPINSETSGNITITTSMGQTHNFFRPTTYNKETTLNNVSYGTAIQIWVPKTVGNYTFSYWVTEDGTFTTSTINLTVTRNLRCVAVFEPTN